MLLQKSPLPECKNRQTGPVARYMKLLVAVFILVSTGLRSQAQQLPLLASPQQTQDDPIYAAVEHPAEFPGGVKAFKKFLGENLQATKEMISGRVLLQFVVRKDGSLTDIKVVHGINQLNDEEAIRVMKLSPKWQPAMQNGHAVNLQFTVPIEFKQA